MNIYRRVNEYLLNIDYYFLLEIKNKNEEKNNKRENWKMYNVQSATKWYDTRRPHNNNKQQNKPTKKYIEERKKSVIQNVKHTKWPYSHYS